MLARHVPMSILFKKTKDTYKMSFCKIQHSIYPNTLNIFVYTANICNYKCKYCTFSNYNSSTSFLDLLLLKNFIISLYNIRKQDIYIEFIGGEPTLDKNILNFSDDIAKFYPNIRLGIYTNFSQDINLYKKLAENKVNMTITWHSLNNMYHNKNFITKLSKLPEKIYNSYVDVHVMYEVDAIDESIFMFNILKQKYASTELRLLDHDFKTK